MTAVSDATARAAELVTDGTKESAPRTRNRRGEGARLRPRIVAAAAELLDAGGSEEAVTLRAVARRVGIAAPSIYPHFADRQAILLAIVQEAFGELTQQMVAASSAADPVVRLHAVCAAYLDFAVSRPQRYRVMFAGVWNVERALDSGAISEAEAGALGRDALAVLVAGVQGCADAGRSSSDDPSADGVALWLGLHGLAHQRTAATNFPWPPDITKRIVNPLAHLLPPA